MIPRLIRALLLTTGLFASAGLLASAAQAQTYCVYDPAGAGGDYYAMARDYQVAAKSWGVSLKLQPYTDDARLSADFRAGSCDMASLLGMRAREFNKFTGTLDAPGVMESYAQVRAALGVLATPKLAPYMNDSGYETVGILPLGAAYVVTEDRTLTSLDKAVGKRVAIMERDATQPRIAESLGARPVPMDFGQFAPALTSGKVDVVITPMVLYKALDMDSIIGAHGGIIRRPILQTSLQLMTHHERFPADFGQHSREYVYSQLSLALATARNTENQVDNRLWLYAMHQQQVVWERLMHTLLDKMANDGLYDRHMLNILQRVRCSTDPQNEECAAPRDALAAH